MIKRIGGFYLNILCAEIFLWCVSRQEKCQKCGAEEETFEVKNVDKAVYLRSKK